MATSTLRHEAVTSRPAAAAAARLSRASLALGGLGIASAIFLVSSLFGSWRVAPRTGSHQLTVLGQVVSYPVANAEAIAILLLAALGSVVTAVALGGAARELRASRRFHRGLACEDPQPLRGALVIADAQPRAFCAGLLRPRVYVSTGALAILDDAALSAVVAHEHHHAQRYDPLRLAAGRVLSRALFFLPGFGDLVERQQALAELSADESAVDGAPANRSALARAMLSFTDVPASAGPSGIDPARVDYLLGEAPQLGVSGPAVRRGGVCHSAARRGRRARRTSGQRRGHTLGSVSSRQPCIVVLAAIPTAVGILAAAYRRGRGRGRA